jgi:hypothetical protein
VCGAAVAPTDERCPGCGLSLAGVYGRPGPYSRSTIVWMGAGLAAVYALTLLVVALAR